MLFFLLANVGDTIMQAYFQFPFYAALVGLFVAAVLAVYSFATPGAEGPVFLLSFACAAAAAVVRGCGVAPGSALVLPGPYAAPAPDARSA